MTTQNKKVLKTEVERDGQKVKLAVIRPDSRVVQEGQKVYNRAFREALESGAILHARVEHYMREQKLWDDTKAEELKRLSTIVTEGEKKLSRGGIKLSEARKIALDMRQARVDVMRLTETQLTLRTNTAEGQAENARFNYFVSTCTVYQDTGKSYFASLEDYLERAKEESAFEACQALAQLVGGYDEEQDKELPENAFLLKYKLVDDKLRLINTDGHLVDSQGRLIDDQGYFVHYDEQGKKQRVDRDGNSLNEKGDYVFEDAQPFEDDVFSAAPAITEST